MNKQILYICHEIVQSVVEVFTKIFKNTGSAQNQISRIYIERFGYFVSEWCL